MVQLLLIALIFTGLYTTITVFFDNIPSHLRNAVKKRNETGLSDTQLMLHKASLWLEPKIELSAEKKKRLERDLQILGSVVTAEYFIADAIATSLLYAVIGLALSVFSPLLGLMAALAIFTITFRQQTKKLKTQLEERRIRIERELPQFAGVITQQLPTTRDIETILSTYRKVCGATLKDEITHTINDIKTQSVERALHSFEQRVGSSKLNELVRGLMAAHQGENQLMFFTLLTEDLTKAQTESISQELQNRPGKLNTYFVAAMGAFFLMLISVLANGMDFSLFNF